MCIVYECRTTCEILWTFIFRSQMLITIVVGGGGGGGGEECMRSFRSDHITPMAIAHEHITHNRYADGYNGPLRTSWLLFCCLFCGYLMQTTSQSQKRLWQLLWHSSSFIHSSDLDLVVFSQIVSYAHTQCACASNRIDFVHTTKQCLPDRSPSSGNAATMPFVEEKSLETTNYKSIVIHSVTFGMVYAVRRRMCARVCVWSMERN